jgi:hypothetical protein
MSTANSIAPIPPLVTYSSGLEGKPPVLVYSLPHSEPVRERVTAVLTARGIRVLWPSPVAFYIATATACRDNQQMCRVERSDGSSQWLDEDSFSTSTEFAEALAAAVLGGA